MQIDLGKIKITWRGDFVSGTLYEVDDAIHVNGSSYICTEENSDVVFNAAKWDVMAAGLPAFTEHGQIVFRGVSGVSLLQAGTSGNVLTTRGVGEDPEWTLPSSRQGSTVVGLPFNTPEGGYRSGGAIMADGTIRSWGEGTNAMHGTGAQYGDRNFPVMPAFPNTNLTIEKWVRAGQDNWCIMSDGSVYVWGNNQYGALGVGNTSDVEVPTKVTALDGVNIIDIAVGGGSYWTYTHAMFLADDGTMYAAGYNLYGQLGVGDNINKDVPTALTKSDWSSVIVVGAQYGRTFAIDAAGDLFAWGYQNNGELGLGSTTTDFNAPAQVTLPASCVKVSGTMDDNPAAGVQVGGHTIALLSDGSVYSWGYGAYGQLGLGTTISFASPQFISSLGTSNSDVLAGGGDWGCSIVVKNDNTLRMFGRNNYGQLGTNDFVDKSSPVIPVSMPADNIDKVSFIGGNGYTMTAVLYDTGKLFVSGYNGNGQLGVGDTTSIEVFAELSLYRNFITDFCGVGIGVETGLGIITQDGKYFQTGYAGADQLPQSNGSPSYVPYHVQF